MKLSCTVFEILSLIFQTLKTSRDNDHAPFRDNLPSIGCDSHIQTLHQMCSPFDRVHTTSYSNLIKTIRLPRTVFDILSLIFLKLKRSRDSDHAPFRNNLSSVSWDLLCSTHIIRFEMSTINRKKEMKGDAKCKNSRVEPPVGRLRGNARGSSMAQQRKAHCRLPISDN